MNFYNIKPISKISILDMNKEKIKSNNINLSDLFWGYILDPLVFLNFIENKYYNNKEIGVFERQNIDFISKNLGNIFKKIDFINTKELPNGINLFFSYRLFSRVLDYYNSYYNDSGISISLRFGLSFKHDNNSLDNYFENINQYGNNKFVIDIVSLLINKNILVNKGKHTFIFKIFWPSEFTTIGIITNEIKKIIPGAKIVLDLSGGNEQFDFTQWLEIIKDEKRFFKLFDFFIFLKDYGKSINDIKDFISGKIKNLNNILYYSYDENRIIYNTFDDEKKHKNKSIKKFIEITFSENNIIQILGRKAIVGRFLPYKCYWSNCNFCAINSQNKFTFSDEYGYDFFIDKWIKFINEYNIKGINFKDEALPPQVIIKFAKKIIENNININYQFRTRFEKIYTLENCQLLFNSGLRYCGMGLESAVDRINESIGNKGNKGITIKDKVKIIHNFDKVGISFHNYSIMGFPGETDKESAATYSFLKGNINKSSFYTCTPNIFGLMKGPEIFTNRDKYGIKINENDIKNPFKLIFNFSCNGITQNIYLLKKFANDIHFAQLIPWIKNKNIVNSRDFWDYIDRTGVFYIIKRYSATNPFIVINNINAEIINKDYDIILNNKFYLMEYIQIFEEKTKFIIYNWITYSENSFDLLYLDFFKNYDDNLSLMENIKDIDGDSANSFIKKLIEDKILLLK